MQFNMKVTTLVEVREVIIKQEVNEPRGTSYKVRKKCLLVLKNLLKLIKVDWRQKRISESWQLPEGCLIPKVKLQTHQTVRDHFIIQCRRQDFLLSYVP